MQVKENQNWKKNLATNHHAQKIGVVTSWCLITLNFGKAVLAAYTIGLHLISQIPHGLYRV